MAIKVFQLFSFISLLFLILSQTGYAKRNVPSDKKSLSSDLIKNLEGCHKGNNTKGIHMLKTYLQKFGYLQYQNQTHANDDDFDDTLESALKIYQQNNHIKPTGILDATTISKMITPRCGVPDIINGTNYMQPHKKRHDSNSSNIHAVSHYSFFPRQPRWSPSKTHLTYRFLPNIPTNAMAPVESAFQKWASATHFTFSQAGNNQNANLEIGFYSRDHGDGYPFDGPSSQTIGRTIAHAFAPEDGRFHYDADEQWSVGPAANALDLETVALHEIGHLLGLEHSEVEAAIMYPSISAGETKNLHPDDIQGIKALYNV